MPVRLALAAGVVTAIASWLILRSGERDQDRIERSLGVARARAPRARISVARLADAAGVLAPEGLVASLGGFTPELGPTGRRRIRTLSAALGIAVLPLVFVHPLWFVGLLPPPPLPPPPLPAHPPPPPL